MFPRGVNGDLGLPAPPLPARMAEDDVYSSAM